jgi:uncharacterized low-complexity protein
MSLDRSLEQKSGNKPLVGKLGVALTGGVLLSAQALLLSSFVHAAGNGTAEGKCGEGKCGTGKASQSTAAHAEGKCGEGKCGEGKCGDASFGKTDTNHDGKVSRAEFLAVAAKRAADFDRLDTNRDGFINEKEAHDFLKATYEANGKQLPKGLFSTIAD